MAISGYQRTAGFHAAGGDPDIINRNFGAFFTIVSNIKDTSKK
jgi:hypothetical protein